jgi:hypothetical protein
MSMRRARPRFAAAVLLCCLGAGIGPLHAAGSSMFSTAGTSDKPQSKLWHVNGSWWAAMNNSSTLALYRLSGTTWTKQLDLQSAVTPILQGGTSDVLWDGTHLFVAVFASTSFKIYKLSFDAGTDSYTLLAGFPVTVPIPGSGAETIVLDKDSLGRLWVAFESGQQIKVLYSTSGDHLTWTSTPVVLSGTVEADDIATVLAFGGDKIGVLWTDQRLHQVGFRVHEDSDPPAVWQPAEVVRSGFGIVDDHINAKADGSGRVYFVAKDYFDAIWVGKRDPDGTWTVTTGASGLDCGTRPILQLDLAANKLYVLYTRWSACVSSGVHAIEERVTYLDNLLFSLPAVLITSSGVSMNDVQGCKQPLPDSSLAVVCAGSNGIAYWAGWGPTSGIGGADPGGLFPPPPAPPTSINATTVDEDPSTNQFVWRMDEGGGTSLADASGNGRNGTLGVGLSTPVWTGGVTGSGLYFDGEDYVSVPRSGLLFNGSDPFTLEAWFKVDLTNAPGTGAFVSRANVIHSNYELTLNNDEFEFGWSTGDTTDTSVKGYEFVRDGAWHHVAAVYDGSQGRIYVDGDLQASKSMPGPVYTSTWPVYVGAAVDGAIVDKAFTGWLDLVAISDEEKYSGDFAPPLLYPNATTRYARVTWIGSTSAAGIAGYQVSRGTNGSPTVVLTSLTPNHWFVDFTASDGLLDFGVRAVDGITQQGADGFVTLAYESIPPQIPTAPRGPSHVITTAASDGPAFWEMDDGIGSSLVDGTDLGHTARLGDPALGDSKEPAWVVGRTNQGLQYDGVDDYVEVADAPDLRFSGSFTIETWARRGSNGTPHALMSKDEGSSKRNYLLLMRSDNKIEFTWVKTSGTTVRTTSSASYTDGNWHHVAGVHDAAALTDYLYIDGVLQGTTTWTGTPFTGPQPVRLGARGSSSGGGALSDRFKGILDLARISAGVRYTAPFTPPITLTGGPRQQVVRLEWSLPAAGLVKDYKVYRQVLPAGMPAFLQLVPGSALAAVDLDVVDDGAYRYTISATNSDDVEGPQSDPYDVTVPPPVGVSEDALPLPPGVRLRVAPNPFNPATRVRFMVERPGPVDLALFDARGRLVEVLFRGVLPAGVHQVDWGRRGRARHASGVYFVRLRCDGREHQARAVLVQ